AVDRIVFIAPVSIALVGWFPKAAIGGVLVEALLKFASGGEKLVGVALVSKQDLESGPTGESPVHLGVDEGIFVGSPDHIEPITPPSLFLGIGHHFDEAVSIGVAAQQVIENAFAGGLLAFEPAVIAGKVEEFSDVDDPTRLRIHEVTPLGFVIAER